MASQRLAKLLAGLRKVVDVPILSSAALPQSKIRLVTEEALSTLDDCYYRSKADGAFAIDVDGGGSKVGQTGQDIFKASVDILQGELLELGQSKQGSVCREESRAPGITTAVLELFQLLEPGQEGSDV